MSGVKREKTIKNQGRKGISWQFANCRGRPVCLPELAVVSIPIPTATANPESNNRGSGFRTLMNYGHLY